MIESLNIQFHIIENILKTLISKLKYNHIAVKLEVASII